MAATAVELSVLSETKEEPPGSFVTHVFALSHEAPTATTYRLAYDAPPNWGLLGAPDSIALAAGSEETLFITVTIPPGALAQTYEIAITATAEEDPRTTASAAARVVVTPTRAIELLAPTGAAGSPGDTLTYSFVLVNRGNAQDAFAIEASSSKGYTATITPTTIDLAPQERVTLEARIEFPSDAVPGRDVTTVRAVSTLYEAVEAQATVFTTILPPGPDQVGRRLMETLPGRINLSFDQDVFTRDFSSQLTFSTSGEILGGFFSSSVSASSPLGPEPFAVESFSILYRREPATYTVGNVSQRLTELVRLACTGGSVVIDEQLFWLGMIGGGSDDETRFAGRLAVGPERARLGVSYLGIRDPSPSVRSVWSATADAEPLEDWTIGLEASLGLDGSRTSRAFLFDTRIDTADLFFHGIAFSVGSGFPGTRSDSAGIEASYRLRLSAFSLSTSLRHVWDNVIRDPLAETRIVDELGFNLSTTPLDEGPTLSTTAELTWQRAPDVAEHSEIDTLLAASVTETDGVFPYALSGKLTDRIDHVLGTHVRRTTFSEGAGLSIDSLYLFLKLTQEKQVDVVSDLILSSSSDVAVRFRPEGTLHAASLRFGNTVDEFDLAASLQIRFLDWLDLVFDGSISWERVDAQEISFGWGIALNADVALPTPFFVTKGQIEGQVFVDRDGDGVFGPADQPLGDVLLVANGSEAASAADGRFRFRPFYPGTYTLTVRDLPVGASVPDPIDVVLQAGEVERIDVALAPVVTVTGRLFDDRDRDAIPDEDEGGFAQVRVQLLDGERVILDARTDLTGRFSFPDVQPGDYTVVIAPDTLPDRFEFTTDQEVTIEVGAQPPPPVLIGGIVPPREIIITFQPPTADFEFEPPSPRTGEAVTFDGSLSFDFDGEIVSYAWDFDDDGEIDVTGPIVDHVFASPGSYEVSLTVQDDGKNEDTLTRTVEVGDAGDAVRDAAVKPPIADFTFAPEPPVVGEPVQFDGTASSDPDGSIVSYAWDFDGDGEVDTTGGQVQQTFSAPGTVTVSLTVADDEGNRDTLERTLDVEEASDAGSPVATFQVSPREPTAGEPLQFNGTSSLGLSGHIVEFAWDFDGDGAIDSTLPIAEHRFDAAGTYPVSLTVTDNEGNTDTVEVQVDVAVPADGGDDRGSFQPPVADFAYMPTSPAPGELTLFNATFSSDFDGQVVRYAWDIDNDGETDLTGAIIEHSFPEEGSYPVSLTITDDDGNSDTLTLTVVVD